MVKEMSQNKRWLTKWEKICILILTLVNRLNFNIYIYVISLNSKKKNPTTSSINEERR